MNKSKKVMLAAASMALLGAFCACGNQEELRSTSYAPLRPGETVETLAVLTDVPVETTTALPVRGVAYAIEEHEPATTGTTLASTTTTTTTTTVVTTETTTTTLPTEFTLSDEEVADKMHEYFAEKGYNDAQIAGIVGNAEVESGLEPSRGVSGGGFGLFQLMDCPQRREMLAEFEAQGVGKYATSAYWALDASDFDTAEDFDTFMTVMLDYTMDQDDPTWMSEIQTANDPETAAEVFLVHYERAVNGGSPIEYYAPYAGAYYQATQSRREAARRWYDYFVLSA